MRAALGVAVAACLAAACAPGPKTEPQATAYRLATTRPEPPTASPSFPQTALQVVPATGSFAASRTQIFYSLAYRSQAHVSRYGESRWAAPPQRMIGRTVASWLAASGHWQAVVGPEAWAPADYVLKLEIHRILQVFPQPQESEAILTLQADLKGPEDRLQAQRLFTYRHPTQGHGARATADAQNRNLTRFCRELEDWLLQAMAQAPARS
ncbi:ABC-type transport auxiliary lipoprotein family protein [Thiohalorhabdus sp.]|uniref:ABC-type transport auxiliary lipoprotein family protein n=1 Tax=Thiohalorhabdus sp. TaxID=3094134 RepID=UPI002FC37906